VQSIFGSVTRDDIVAQIKKELITDPEGSRVALAAESVEIKGLEHDDGNRIKRLGSFEILIHVEEKRDPVKRIVQVVPLEDAPEEAAKAEAAESS
jgi:ribosomal protein L9